MNRRGFTLGELLVVATILIVMLGLLIPAVSRPGRRDSRQVKDSTQIKQIHVGWLTAAADSRGVFPLPGEINRAADPTSNNQRVPGRGPIDESRNDHDSLHAACIANNLISAQILYSPAEASGRVAVCSNYNFNSYNPAQGKYWDEHSFTCDLGVKCNTSYAVTPLDKTYRRDCEWRNTSNSKFIVLSNRGVKGGDALSGDYKNSKTLDIHGNKDSWEGNVCFNDNHVNFERAFYSDSVVPLPAAAHQSFGTKDNLFRNDTNGLRSNNPLRNSDVFLVMQKDAASEGCHISELSSEITWD